MQYGVSVATFDHVFVQVSDIYKQAVHQPVGRTGNIGYLS